MKRRMKREEKLEDICGELKEQKESLMVRGELEMGMKMEMEK